MGIGTLGTPVSLAAATYATIYTVPAGKAATININLVNIKPTSVLVRVAISATAVPGDHEWLEYDAYLKPAGDPSNGNVLERSALTVEAGKNIVCYSSAAGVAARAYGSEG